MFTLAALLGLRFLTSGMRALNDHVELESTISQQVVVPVPLAQRELTPVTVGGAAEAATPRPTNGDTPANPPRPNHAPVPAAGDATANASSPAGERPATMILLYIWILLFGFIGTQLAWTLRPFLGSPGAPFELFCDIGGTFYSDILSTLGDLLS